MFEHLTLSKQVAWLFVMHLTSLTNIPCAIIPTCISFSDSDMHYNSTSGSLGTKHAAYIGVTWLYLRISVECGYENIAFEPISFPSLSHSLSPLPPHKHTHTCTPFLILDIQKDGASSKNVSHSLQDNPKHNKNIVISYMTYGFQAIIDIVLYYFHTTFNTLWLHTSMSHSPYKVCKMSPD